MFSPEILVFLFFMITDPKTVPAGARRGVYAVGVGLLAALLIAPQTTEFATKVALLGALALVCVARPLLEALRAPPARRGSPHAVARSAPRASRCARCRRRAGRPAGHPAPGRRRRWPRRRAHGRAAAR